MSAEIMKLHHSKHHQAYVTNLNVAEEQFLEATAKGNVAAAQVVIPSLRCEQQWRGAVRGFFFCPMWDSTLRLCTSFNGGGHINHTIFWTNLAPPSQGGGEPPSGDLLAEINKTFGSVQKFQVPDRGVENTDAWTTYLLCVLQSLGVVLIPYRRRFRPARLPFRARAGAGSCVVLFYFI